MSSTPALDMVPGKPLTLVGQYGTANLDDPGISWLESNRHGFQCTLGSVSARVALCFFRSSCRMLLLVSEWSCTSCRTSDSWARLLRCIGSGVGSFYIGGNALQEWL